MKTDLLSAIRALVWASSVPSKRFGARDPSLKLALSIEPVPQERPGPIHERTTGGVSPPHADFLRKAA